MPRLKIKCLHAKINVYQLFEVLHFHYVNRLSYLNLVTKLLSKLFK